MSEKILSVPYKSQWDNDATGSKNDCGPCSLAMVLNKYGKNVTTNEILEKTGAGGGYVSFQQLQKIASDYGFTSRIERNRSLQRLKDLIDQDIPPIVVVHYGYLSSRQDQEFKGGHIMVVVGYRDDGYFVNDPDFWGNFRPDGDHHFYKKDEFEKSWEKSIEDENQANTLFFLQPNEPTQPSEDNHISDIKDYLVSVGYTYPEAHLEVIKELYKSDLKIKSGKYILSEGYISKKDCDKEKEDLKVECKEKVTKLKLNFEIEKKEAINEIHKEAEKECEEKFKSQIAEWKKVTNSIVYKIAETISSFYEVLKLLLKTIFKGGK